MKVKSTAIVNSSNVAAIPVATTATVYTMSIPIGWYKSGALYITATSDGAVDVLVSIEEGVAKPTTEGSADTAWAVPDGAGTLVNITDENLHPLSLSGLVTGPYMRLKLVGQGSNAASTTLSIKIAKSNQAD